MGIYYNTWIKVSTYNSVSDSDSDSVSDAQIEWCMRRFLRGCRVYEVNIRELVNSLKLVYVYINGFIAVLVGGWIGSDLGELQSRVSHFHLPLSSGKCWVFIY